MEDQDYQYSPQRGAVGLLSTILLTTVVLIFMLTISLQVLLGVKNAKIDYDFDKIYYATEGGMRDARFRLKLEDVLSKTFQDISQDAITIERSASIGLTAIDVRATGTAQFIRRLLRSQCQPAMDGCTLGEQSS